MKICVTCKVELHCLKNGVGADFGHEHVYAGDLYSCGICGMEVLLCNSWPSKDLEYKNQEYYINVKSVSIYYVRSFAPQIIIVYRPILIS